MRVRPRQSAESCPLCKELLAGQLQRVCPDCLTAYHSECFSELGGCAVIGCSRRGHVPAPPPRRDAEGRLAQPHLARLSELSADSPWLRVEGMQVVVAATRWVGQPLRGLLLALGFLAGGLGLLSSLWLLMGLGNVVPYLLPPLSLLLAGGALGLGLGGSPRVVLSSGLEEVRVGPRGRAPRRWHFADLSALAVAGRRPLGAGDEPEAWRYRLVLVPRAGVALPLGPWRSLDEAHEVGEVLARELGVELHRNPGAQRLLLEPQEDEAPRLRFVPGAGYGRELACLGALIAAATGALCVALLRGWV
ncbi:MAG TPA: hypothetical protein DEA08_29210 [Planctomycetes bacterium]|nr:hypothetical protein [Planctomycetota bacterium]